MPAEPATQSFVFANNKGGSGKTFILFQLACEAANANKDRNVLVIDFSLYSDTSGLLMGGLRREKPLSPTTGHQNTVDNTTPETRAEGLVRALENRSKSVFGAWFTTQQTTTQEVDLSQYWIQPATVNERIPTNMYLVASAADLSWGSQHTGNANGDNMDVDLPIWARQNSKDWEPVAQKLRNAVTALRGDWIVFVDTDHLASSPLTKLGLGAMDKTVVPLSLDDCDFSRMFHDPTGNALFKDVMMQMAKDGKLTALVSTFIFTKMTSQCNEEGETPVFRIKSPFTPAIPVKKQMDRLAESLRDVAHDEPLMQQALHEYSEHSARSIDFGRYFTACKTVSDVSLDVSKRFGIPLCVMDSNDGRDENINMGTVTAMKLEFEYLFKRICGVDPDA